MRTIKMEMRDQEHGQEYETKRAGMSRRRFLKYAAGVAAGLGLGASGYSNRHYLDMRVIPNLEKGLAKATAEIGIYTDAAERKIASLNNARPNMILLSLDTLRRDFFTADYMPLSYEWVCKNALLFPHAYANAPWTLTSHASMFTGLLPHEHGVQVETDVRKLRSLDVLPQLLNENGYHTVAFTGGGIASKIYFGKGFDKYKEFVIVTDKQFFEKTQFDSCCDKAAEFGWILDYLSTIPIEHKFKPIFSFLHTYYVHAYECERERLTGDLVAPSTSQEDIWKFFSKLRDTHNGEELRKRYARAVRDFDAILRKFLEDISSSAISDNLVMVITSDHGEGLGEEYNFPKLGGRYRDYTSMRHSSGVLTTSELVRVPFVYYDNKRRGINNNLVDIRNIFGTMLNLARVDGDYPTIFDGCNEVRSENVNNIYTLSDLQGTSNPQRFAVEKKKSASPSRIPSKTRDQLKALGYL